MKAYINYIYIYTYIYIYIYMYIYIYFLISFLSPFLFQNFRSDLYFPLGMYLPKIFTISITLQQLP